MRQCFVYSLKVMQVHIKLFNTVAGLRIFVLRRRLTDINGLCGSKV